MSYNFSRAAIPGGWFSIHSFPDYHFDVFHIAVRGKYTGDEKRIGTDIRYNVADAVYAIDYTTPIKTM